MPNTLRLTIPAGETKRAGIKPALFHNHKTLRSFALSVITSSS